jgi:hypothetical protein
MPAGVPAGAMCVQRFDDSLNSAIHITYRISLRSSSMPEPRDPLLKVLIHFVFGLSPLREIRLNQGLVFPGGRPEARRPPRAEPAEGTFGKFTMGWRA